MKKLAALGLAGVIAVGSIAAAGTAEARSRHGWVPFAVGAGILTLGAIAASQANAYPDYYAYEPYPYAPYPYGYTYAPAPRTIYRSGPVYRSDSWCRQQGDYNAYTGRVTEPNGSSWQCGPGHR
jgi:hypothetical protein